MRSAGFLFQGVPSDALTAQLFASMLTSMDEPIKNPWMQNA
jgi:hypothetical protein